MNLNKVFRLGDIADEYFDAACDSVPLPTLTKDTFFAYCGI